MDMGDDEQTMADSGSQPRSGVNRRTALKAAAGVGTAALVWTAPRIDTLGFAPAGASHFGSQCVILSPASDDKNSNDDDNAFCPNPAATSCCGQSFGNEGQIDRFTFLNPTPTCSKLVVRTISLNCSLDDPNGNVPKPKNPDLGQFAVVIESTTGTCECTVLDGVLVASSGREVLKSLNNGPSTCLGDGVDASLACDDVLLTSSSRLAVRITCESGIGCT